MKLILNGEQILKSDYTGADKAVIEITDTDDQGNRARGVSQQFNLTGHAFDIVDAAFISNPTGKTNHIPVKIYDDVCCSEDVLLFEGILTGENVNWCHGECIADVLFTEQTAETLAIDCIRSTMVYDNRNGFQNQTHPRMVYCVEVRPDVIAHIWMVVVVIGNLAYAIMNGLLQVIQWFINGVNGVLDAINAFFGSNFSLGPVGSIGDTNGLINQFQSIRDQMNQRAIGCGRKHPSPLVRSYVNNVCNICGLTFSSSIYNQSSSDYYNAVYLSAPVRKGEYNDQEKYIIENKPNLTLDLFLDQFVPMHNGKWKIIGTTLHFERKDHPVFVSGIPFVSYDDLDTSGFITERLCLSFRTEETPSIAEFKYSPDPVDVAGNEAKERFNFLAEWNSPYSSLQAGKKDVILPFGAPRFRDDGVENDILALYENAPGGIGDTIQNNDRVLILEKHLCFNPKVLIWDGNTLFGRTRYFEIWPVNGPSWTTFENYNSPYMFNDYGITPNVAYPSDYDLNAITPASAYVRFYTIDNPKVIIDEGKQWSFSFMYNCQNLQNAFTARYVQLPMGLGRISQLSVNLDDKTITVSGEV